MKTLTPLTIALLSALIVSPALADTIINFDSGLPVAPTAGNQAPALTTYDGFNWTGFDAYTQNSIIGGGTPIVLNNAAPSAPNAAVTYQPSNIFTSTVNQPFTFVSFSLGEATSNAAAYGVLTGTITGINAQGNTVATQAFTATSSVQTVTLSAAFKDITEIEFTTDTYLSFDNIDLTYGANSVNLSATPGLNPNQAGVASVIDQANAGVGSPSLGTLTTALQGLPSSSLGAALDELMPLKFNSFASTTAFNNESFEVAEMDSYLAGLRDGADGGFLAGNGQLDTSGLTVNDPNVDPGLQMIHSRMLAWNQSNSTMSDVPDAVLGGIAMKDPKEMKDAKDMKSCNCAEGNTPWDFFVRGNVVLGQGYSQADQPHFDDNTAAVVVGADYHITRHFLAGLTLSYAHTDATLDTANSSATVDSYSPGVYASYADKGWFANFLGRYSYNSYTESRNISFLGQTANGATDGNEGMADLDGGYEFHNGPFTYGPVAGLTYTHLTVNSYQESGSVADLHVQEDQSDSLRSRLGGAIRFTLHDYGVLLTPHLTATWQHEFMDSSRNLTSQFSDSDFSSNVFSVRTEGASDDFALVDVGLTAQVNDMISVFGDYLVQAGQSNYFGQSVQAGVNLRF